MTHNLLYYESLFAVQSEKVLKSVSEHKALISDLQTSKDQTMVVTASKDTSAKVSHFLCREIGMLNNNYLSCSTAV